MSDTTAGTGTVTTEGTEGAPHGSTEGTETGAETPTIETLQAEVEKIKAESRKWEARAKENKKAKDALDEKAREGMTEVERVQADLSQAQTTATEAVERAERAEAALTRLTIAVEFNLDAEDVKALEGVSDETALRTLAERLSGRSGTTPPRPRPSQGAGGGKPKQTTAEVFADAIEGLF